MSKTFCLKKVKKKKLFGNGERPEKRKLSEDSEPKKMCD